MGYDNNNNSVEGEETRQLEKRKQVKQKQNKEGGNNATAYSTDGTLTPTHARTHTVHTYTHLRCHELVESTIPDPQEKAVLHDPEKADGQRSSVIPLKIRIGHPLRHNVSRGEHAVARHAVEEHGMFRQSSLDGVHPMYGVPQVYYA